MRSGDHGTWLFGDSVFGSAYQVTRFHFPYHHLITFVQMKQNKTMLGKSTSEVDPP